ncbi:hypothetical protein BOTBODRAFT_176915 [Botryobasidium botryosum FD-172 SS1]|uniref:Uncharacterized protein n=1 Tax=Botryobasidium botryosum (strain FD-172 SS1) TaxID=930990 RepID=A0A067MJ82_BOTB1|nr:hypothetical protein BOTBODRAFT_176915 [Botryobasidium botryosum FD-172 SS1]
MSYSSHLLPHLVSFSASFDFFDFSRRTPTPRYYSATYGVNVFGFPTNPTHPRLLDTVAEFSLLPNGTYGDRDPLFTTYPYQKNRVWMHYMPSVKMWVAGCPGFDAPPIFIKLKLNTPSLWVWRGGMGSIAPSILSDLRRFHDAAASQAQSLRDSARDYVRMPIYGRDLQWDSVQGEGHFDQMAANLVSLQRRIAELYGWVFLQEKLQQVTHSINPRPPPPPREPVPQIDWFNGVIVPWERRSPSFDAMALSHGVPLWWCDYLVNPSDVCAPWRGLPGSGRELMDLHRGSGYESVSVAGSSDQYCLKVDDTGATRSPLDTIVSTRPVDTARFLRVAPPNFSGTTLALQTTDGAHKRSAEDAGVIPSRSGQSSQQGAVPSSQKKRKPNPSKRQREARRKAKLSAGASTSP